MSRKEESRTTKPIKKTEITTYFSMITVNINNGLNFPIKRKRLADLITK
jgi:hypothetical protein